MPDSRRAIYWDSNVFLSYVNEIPDRVPTLEALLADSASDVGSVKLYTSALTHVEVSFAASEQKQRTLDQEIEQRINHLWSDPRALVSVEYHDAIGQSAKSLIRTAITIGWSLKPLDAIHLATAQWLSTAGLALEEFHTYDKDLKKYESIVGLRIIEPYTPQPRMF